MRHVRICSFLAGIALIAGVSPAQPPGREKELQALFVRLHRAISTNDKPTAVAITKELLPDKARIAKALRPDVPADVVSKIDSYFRTRMPSNENQLARMFYAAPENTQVDVYAATAEQLAQYAPDSPAFHFPGGAKCVAKFLRPGMLFYKLDLVKPGEQSGMSMALLFWDGSRWTFLGKIWQPLDACS